MATEARFSSNFLDLDVATGGQAATGPLGNVNELVLPLGPDTGTTQTQLQSPSNPFSPVEPEPDKTNEQLATSSTNSDAFSDHFDPSLVPQTEPGFNFGANLETRDSVSSLEKVGFSNGVDDPPQGAGGGDGSSEGDKQWEEFGGSAPEQAPVANGNAKESGKEGRSKVESVSEEGNVSKKIMSAAKKRESGGAAVCAADAVMSDSTQWTALDDDNQGFVDLEMSEEGNLPFRKTQSMRATTNRRIEIVDTLKQRRLSNTSLDREYKGSQFKDEDDLTRKLKLEKEYQVFVKMDKRVPGTKSKWLPVNIAVRDGVLHIKQSAPPSMPAISSETVVRPDAPPLHEIRLLHNHNLTPASSRAFDKKAKIHQIKLRQTQIVEKRTLRRWFFVEHVSKTRTVVKLGCPDLSVVKGLSDQIGEAVRQLPVTREKGVAYRMNEVFVDVKDYSDILMNCDGAVLERRSLNRIYIQAFLSNSPECKLILNDIEAILLQGKGQMTNSMSRQVRLNDVVLHPCVNKSLYKKNREIRFCPVDGYPFELLRCSIDPYISPPVNVTALMEYSEQRNTVRISSSFSVRKKHNIKLRPIKDLVIRFPIPASWSSLFRADTVFGGSKSVRSTSSLRGSFRRKIKSSSCQIHTQLGSAKYEAEHGSILWRIGQYVETPVPHTLRCDIQLQSGMHKPDIMSEHAEVSFTLPGSSTGLQIRAFKVDKCTPERWVKYEILYRYRVQMFPDLSID